MNRLIISISTHCWASHRATAVLQKQHCTKIRTKTPPTRKRPSPLLRGTKKMGWVGLKMNAAILVLFCLVGFKTVQSSLGDAVMLFKNFETFHREYCLCCVVVCLCWCTVPHSARWCTLFCLRIKPTEHIYFQLHFFTPEMATLALSAKPRRPQTVLPTAHLFVC